MKGFYQDKSTTIKTYHHLKLVFNSPHFNETDIDATFWRDESELSFSVETEHGTEPYALEVKHTTRDAENQISKVKLIVIDKVYTVTAEVRTHDGRHLLLEINVDK